MGDLLLVCGLTWLTMLTQEANSVKIVLIEKVGDWDNYSKKSDCLILGKISMFRQKTNENCCDFGRSKQTTSMKLAQGRGQIWSRHA